MILSSEEEDNTPEQLAKTLRAMGVTDSAVLEADDYHQKYTLRVNIRHTYVVYSMALKRLHYSGSYSFVLAHGRSCHKCPPLGILSTSKHEPHIPPSRSATLAEDVDFEVVGGEVPHAPAPEPEPETGHNKPRLRVETPAGAVFIDTEAPPSAGYVHARCHWRSVSVLVVARMLYAHFALV